MVSLSVCAVLINQYTEPCKTDERIEIPGGGGGGGGRSDAPNEPHIRRGYIMAPSSEYDERSVLSGDVGCCYNCCSKQLVVVLKLASHPVLTFHGLTSFI